MSDLKREKIGGFVITYARDAESLDITCAMCGILLSTYDAQNDSHIPSCDNLVLGGRVAVPNFGWFCSQKCGGKYEKEFNTQFQKDLEGNINYD